MQIKIRLQGVRVGDALEEREKNVSVCVHLTSSSLCASVRQVSWLVN